MNESFQIHIQSSFKGNIFTQASKISLFNLRGDDAEEATRSRSSSTKYCNGQDCQQWSVGPWSKVRFVLTVRLNPFTTKI